MATSWVGGGRGYDDDSSCADEDLPVAVPTPNGPSNSMFAYGIEEDGHEVRAFHSYFILDLKACSIVPQKL